VWLIQRTAAVFKAAVVGMADVTAEVLKRNDVAVGDLAWLIPHQANGRIIEAVAKPSVVRIAALLVDARVPAAI
jgi:3-oxoacyl-[acyl-carrier-protein] synthase III